MTTYAHLTRSDYLALVAMAGDDFNWGGSHARPASDVRAGLMAFLLAYAGGQCAMCGDTLTGAWEVCHIVSGGQGRRGWVPGNLAAGCLDCNDADGENGPVIRFETILRADLIPAEWPSNAEFRAMGKAAKAEKEMRRQEKMAKRGM